MAGAIYPYFEEMNSRMIFESTVQILGPFPSFPQTAVREETSQARVPIAEALKTSGPIHRAFIEALPDEWRNDPEVTIFSRTLWLKEGWYPLTPHYHFDWGAGIDGPKVETLMCLLGDMSRTEFVLGSLEHPEVQAERGSMGGGGMNRWEAQVEAGLSSGKLKTWEIEPEKLILFDNRTLHRARPARKTGWRLLVRAIRGKTKEGGYDTPRSFSTCRNGFVPETAEERLRYEPYSDRGAPQMSRAK